VTIDGNRYTFQAGSYKSSGPIDFVGDVTLDCNTTRCRISGTANMPIPPHEIRVVDDKLVMVSSATLTPYGTTTICGQPGLPGAGVIDVSGTATVGGRVVPATVSMTGGAWGGVGTECSSAGYQVGWDLKGTRVGG
jgi:hypothetical protein